MGKNKHWILLANALDETLLRNKLTYYMGEQLGLAYTPKSIRFENVRVEYYINDDSFSVPALTVQPIVENAIKHGVRTRDEGIVRVSTQRKEKYHEIVISDNGIGFDTTQQSDSETGHIGIKNAEEILHKMCHGTVSVESKPGEGTTVTLHIPL